MELEERLRKLENECFTNKQRRQLDAHFMGQILKHMVDTRLMDAKQLRQAITQIGEGLKDIAGDAPGAAEIIDEQTLEWLGHIKEPKEFLLSGGVS